MTPDMIEEGIVCLGTLGVILLALGAGCLIADFVFPHIRPLERYLDSLPEFEDDEEIARRYEAIRRKKAAARRKRIQATVAKFFG